MIRHLAHTIICASILISAGAFADDLTKMIQADLLTLGYDPGDVNGEATVTTVVAISKFQAEHGLEVTGEVSPQLAGILKAEINKQNGTVSVSPGPDAQQPVMDPAALQAAQQACLQQKMEAAQESQKKKRGFGALVRAVSRTGFRVGGSDFNRQLAGVTRDVYDANSTASDLQQAAKDLGLTEDDVESCRNPQ